MNDDNTLAETTLCTVTRSRDGLVDVQLGNVIVRLHESELASLTGTLQRVVKQLFPRRAAVPRRSPFRVIEGGANGLTG